MKRLFVVLAAMLPAVGSRAELPLMYYAMGKPRIATPAQASSIRGRFVQAYVNATPDHAVDSTGPLAKVIRDLEAAQARHRKLFNGRENPKIKRQIAIARERNRRSWNANRGDAASQFTGILSPVRVREARINGTPQSIRPVP